jgi:hypothetical protein
MNASVVKAFGDYLKLVEVVDDPPQKEQKARKKRAKIAGVQNATVIKNNF